MKQENGIRKLAAPGRGKSIQLTLHQCLVAVLCDLTGSAHVLALDFRFHSWRIATCFLETGLWMKKNASILLTPRIRNIKLSWNRKHRVRGNRLTDWQHLIWWISFVQSGIQCCYLHSNGQNHKEVRYLGKASLNDRDFKVLRWSYK